MKTIKIPETEYNKLKEEVSLLKDSELLIKVNRLIDLLFEDKYGLYMGNYTDDLSESIVKDSYKNKESGWDRI